MHPDFPYDLVVLRDFEAGWGWDAQLTGLMRKKYRRDLEGLRDLDPGRLAACLGGEALRERPHAAVAWFIRLRPFRPLELFFLLESDPEFGTALRLFYSRGSLTVPTEDAYTFGWDYVALLARYGRGEFPLAPAGPGSGWITFADIEARGAGPLQRYALTGRGEVLPLIGAEVAAAALERLGRGECRGAVGDDWEAVLPVLPDLVLRLAVAGGEVEVAVDDRGAAKYAPEFLLSFAWLYLNAFIREARRVDAALPRLSHYF